MQIVYVDTSSAADGIMSYTGPDPEPENPDRVTDKFSRDADGKLHYEDGSWLACPQTTGEFMVFPEKAYSAPAGKDKCTAFEITTKALKRTPKVVCVFN